MTVHTARLSRTFSASASPAQRTFADALDAATVVAAKATNRGGIGEAWNCSGDGSEAAAPIRLARRLVTTRCAWSSSKCAREPRRSIESSTASSSLGGAREGRARPSQVHHEPSAKTSAKPQEWRGGAGARVLLTEPQDGRVRSVVGWSTVNASSRLVVLRNDQERNEQTRNNRTTPP